MQEARRLKGPEMEDLKNLLGAAFLPQRFNEFLLYRLNRQTWNYAGANDDYPTILLRVIQDANATLWLRDLVWEARKAVPADPGLLAFEERFFSSAPTTVAVDGGEVRPVQGRQLELKIKDAQSTFDIGTWRRRLGEIEGRVCRIEFPEKVAKGTGFLVGPSVVLTNYHVIEKIESGTVAPTEVVLRFDYKVAEDGVTVQAGTIFRLAEDWLLDSSRYSERDKEVAPSQDPAPDELDYALLQVEGQPANAPVGGPTGDPSPVPRKWIEVPAQDYDFTKQRSLYIVQHPDGDPMQVAVDSEAILGLNGNRTRVRYSTTTEAGSSGSPCFGPDWQWVALHHSGDPKYWQGQRPEYNQGIPLPAIRQLLTSRGKADLLGAGV
jgi:V8-like Glu-specific endopeptidase